MFLLRIALVLFVIALFLPSTPEEKEKTYRGVSSAVENVESFCVRNAALCETTSSLAAAAWNRITIAAEMIYEAATGRSAAWRDERRPQYRERSRREEGRTDSRVERSSHTLRQEDLEPEWRGPGAS